MFGDVLSQNNLPLYAHARTREARHATAFTEIIAWQTAFSYWSSYNVHNSTCLLPKSFV